MLCNTGHSKERIFSLRSPGEDYYELMDNGTHLEIVDDCWEAMKTGAIATLIVRSLLCELHLMKRHCKGDMSFLFSFQVQIIRSSNRNIARHWLSCWRWLKMCFNDYASTKYGCEGNKNEFLLTLICRYRRLIWLDTISNDERCKHRPSRKYQGYPCTLDMILKVIATRHAWCRALL